MAIKERTVGSARRTVSEDWVRPLPREKSDTFDSLVGHWNSGYAMMSVSLDDSMALRSRGDLVCARQQVYVAAELFDRVAALLINFCDTVPRYTRHLSAYPAVEPLQTSFFRGSIGQSAASWNEFFHWVLFRDRSRFHYKVRLLADTLRRLVAEFRRSVNVISSGGAGKRPSDSWQTLDCLHYDFNTCLRENEVLLKSFLRALPAQNLGAFAMEMGVPLPKAGKASQPRLSGASV